MALLQHRASGDQWSSIMRMDGSPVHHQAVKLLIDSCPSFLMHRTKIESYVRDSLGATRINKLLTTDAMQARCLFMHASMDRHCHHLSTDQLIHLMYEMAYIPSVAKLEHQGPECTLHKHIVMTSVQ
jgi:hypothetical protein